MNQYSFESCGIIVVPKTQWLDDLLSLYVNGEITAGELFTYWFDVAKAKGGSPEDLTTLIDFGKMCLGLVGA